jgi:hypothetical protein
MMGGGDLSVSKVYGANYKAARKAIGNPNAFANIMLGALEKLGRRKNHPKVMRVHVLGEFFHPDYIRAWINIAQAAPDWNFYAYTRTWKIKSFIPLLDQLRRQPNFNLLLSTDPSTGPALPGWKECGVDVTYNRQGKRCDHDIDKNTTCYACGKCWKPNGPSVFIPVHGIEKKTKSIHEQMTTERKAKYGFNPRKRK